MKPEILVILCFFIAFAAAEAIRTGFFKKDGEKPDDAKVEMISMFALVAFTQPAILFSSTWLMSTFAPGGILVRCDIKQSTTAQETRQLGSASKRA